MKYRIQIAEEEGEEISDERIMELQKEISKFCGKLGIQGIIWNGNTGQTTVITPKPEKATHPDANLFTDMVNFIKGLRGIEAWIGDPKLKNSFQEKIYPLIDKIDAHG